MSQRRPPENEESRAQPGTSRAGPESISFEESIRELIYRRILFIATGHEVYALHFGHGSMLPLKPE